MTREISFATLLAFAVLSVVLGLRQRRLAAASLAAAAFIAFLWMLVVVAQTTDWHDADGWIDCWPRCTPLQDAMPVVLYGGPLIAGTLLLVSVASAIAGSLRRGRDHRG